MSSPRPALLIDAAEWFLDEAWRDHVAPRHWRRLPARADAALRRAAEVLAAAGARATLMVPASLAMRAPALLVQLVEGGHEVGLSVRCPTPLDDVAEEDRAGFRQAWHEERAALEAVIGTGIQGFAAAWSVAPSRGEPWWHPVLRELGFAYDATPVRGQGSTLRSLKGGAHQLSAFLAWHLDDRQPRLRGLPAEVRAPHEQATVGGAERLAALAARTSGTIAAQLGLARRPVGPPPAPRAPVEEDGAGARVAPRLAVVVPLKDEAEGVRSLFVELELLAGALADVARCEFVIVDDGSADDTWMLLERIARNRRRFRLIRHGENRGVAAAIRSGFQATDAELVASIDGDLSYDPMELRHMVPMLAHADVVTASPYHPDGAVRNVPSWRLLLSRTLSRAYRALLRSDVRTWTSCFRAYRRNAVLHLPLKNPGFLGTAELVIRVLRRGGRVAEHPCTLEARLLGFSKMRVLRVVVGHLRLLALVALRVVR
ncbi:MAG: glycosyltransferase [Planctomycetota bacterium]|nr:glycosyltransferase [Planctomycetota bacterium]